MLVTDDRWWAEFSLKLFFTHLHLEIKHLTVRLSLLSRSVFFSSSALCLWKLPYFDPSLSRTMQFEKRKTQHKLPIPSRPAWRFKSMFFQVRFWVCSSTVSCFRSKDTPGICSVSSDIRSKQWDVSCSAASFIMIIFENVCFFSYFGQFYLFVMTFKQLEQVSSVLSWLMMKSCKCFEPTWSLTWSQRRLEQHSLIDSMF